MILDAAPMVRLPEKARIIETGDIPQARTRALRGRTSRDNVGRQLVLDEGDAVAQAESAFFQALNLDCVSPRDSLKGFNRGIEVAMLLAQPLELCFQLDVFVLGHSQPPKSPTPYRRLPATYCTLGDLWPRVRRGTRFAGDLQPASAWMTGESPAMTEKFCLGCIPRLATKCCLKAGHRIKSLVGSENFPRGSATF